MTTEDIIIMQRAIGVTPDGFWGPRSIAACKKHLRDLMPIVSPWPSPDVASLRAFYGEPGDEDNLTVIEFPYPIYYGGKLVKTTRVHKKCAASLLRVLDDVERLMPFRPGIVDEAKNYGGCYNDRNKRGGTTKSLHAWGAAIDLDADDNSFRDAWPVKADMPLEIMECFAKEGWISAGAFWGYDAMHFQATRS